MNIDGLGRLINTRKRLIDIQACLFDGTYHFGLYGRGHYGYVGHHDIADELNKQFIELAKDYYAKRIEEVSKDIKTLCKEQ